MRLPSAPPTPGPPAASGAPPPGFTIRPRRAADLAPLGELLGRQQPSSKYPIAWPLPFPTTAFLQREGEEAAFVAEAVADGALLGHVSVCRCLEPPPAGEEVLGPTWAAAHGCAVGDLRVIGVLFTEPTWAGRGVGSALFAAATDAARRGGGRPVLDVLSTNTGPKAFYERRGWKEVGLWRNTIWIPGTELQVLLYILPDDA